MWENKVEKSRKMEKIYWMEIGVVAILLLSIFLIYGLKNKNIKQYMKIAIPLLILSFLGISIQYLLEKPQMDLLEEQRIEVHEHKQIQKPKVRYHNKDISDKVQVIENIKKDTLGTYEIEYRVPYLNTYITQKQQVKVVDTTPPVLILAEEQENLSYQEEYKEKGATAQDNYDGDITDRIKIEKKEKTKTEWEMIYQVTDSSGNTTQKIKQIHIIDDVKPELVLKGNSSVFLSLGDTYEEKGATAIDEIDGDLTKQIEIIGEVNTQKEGDYSITYQVKDTSGNTAKAIRNVNVMNRNKPASDTGTQNNGKAGTIYLTFDDGPSHQITPHILDVLKQKGVKATFFIVNYDTNKEYLVKRIVQEGHTIAIHGYSHDYSQIYQSEDAYMQNLSKLRQKIKQSTGTDTTITRFPGGSSNMVSKFNPGIMTRLTRLVVGSGYTYFDWNVSSGDAGGANSKEEIYHNVTTALKKSRANVVLMHDLNGKQYTLEALPDIIDYGFQNGYSFQKITKQTPMITHHINN